MEKATTWKLGFVSVIIGLVMIMLSTCALRVSVRICLRTNVCVHVRRSTSHHGARHLGLFFSDCSFSGSLIQT